MSWGSHWIFRCVSPVAGSGVSGAGFTPTEARGNSPSDNRKFSTSEKPQPGSSPPGGFSEKVVEGERVENSSAIAPATPASAARPWNLRTRRAACFAPRENGRNRCPSFSPTYRLFGKDDPGKADHLSLDGREKMQWWKFSFSLSRHEIEEDFYAFKGMKPPRRPQKRVRILQRQLDAREI